MNNVILRETIYIEGNNHAINMYFVYKNSLDNLYKRLFDK